MKVADAIGRPYLIFVRRLHTFCAAVRVYLTLLMVLLIESPGHAKLPVPVQSTYLDVQCTWASYSKSKPCATRTDAKHEHMRA